MSTWTKSLLVLHFLFVAGVKADPLQKSFSDWQVTCNNVGFCVARNIPGDKGLVMTIARHAGVNDRPLLRIDYGSAYSCEVPGASLQDNLLLDSAACAQTSNTGRLNRNISPPATLSPLMNSWGKSSMLMPYSLPIRAGCYFGYMA